MSDILMGQTAGAYPDPVALVDNEGKHTGTNHSIDIRIWCSQVINSLQV